MKYLSAIKNLMTAIFLLDGDYIAKCFGWLVREAKYDAKEKVDELWQGLVYHSL